MLPETPAVTPVAVSLSDILTPTELSKLLKVRVTTVYDWMRRKDCPDAIPYFRVGRFLRFSRDEVSAWMLKTRAAGDKHAHVGGRRHGDPHKTGGKRSRKSRKA